jgi:hypothetical protein
MAKIKHCSRSTVALPLFISSDPSILNPTARIEVPGTVLFIGHAEAPDLSPPVRPRCRRRARLTPGFPPPPRFWLASSRSGFLPPAIPFLRDSPRLAYPAPWRGSMRHLLQPPSYLPAPALRPFLPSPLCVGFPAREADMALVVDC